MSVEQLRRALEIVSVQNRFNLTDRSAEGVLEECERRGIALLPWRPLAVGDFARPGGGVGHIASARGATPAQVALAWLLARSPVIVAIPGTASLGHLRSFAAAGLELTDEQLAALG